MGMFAIQNNVERLAEDHRRAKKIAKTLYDAGFKQPQEGNVDTNIIYFGLPENSKVTKEELCNRLLEDYLVLPGGDRSKGDELFRMSTHMYISDEDVDRALESFLHL